MTSVAPPPKSGLDDFQIVEMEEKRLLEKRR